MIFWVVLFAAGGAVQFLNYYRLGQANPQALVMRGKQTIVRPRYSSALNLVGMFLVNVGVWEIVNHRVANGWHQGAVLVGLLVTAYAPALAAGWRHDQDVKNAASDTP